MNHSRPAALSRAVPAIVALVAAGCASSGAPPAEPPGATPKAAAPVAVVEVLGTRAETDRFVHALMRESEYRGVPITLDRAPVGAPGLGRDEAGRQPRQDPGTRKAWKPSTLLRVEVKPVAAVEKLEKQRPAGEAAARAAASEPSAEYWWEAASDVHVELIDPDGRTSRGFIDVRGEARTERSAVRDASRSEEAMARALEAAAAELLKRLKDQRSSDGTGPRQ